jgi:DNA processing protein
MMNQNQNIRALKKDDWPPLLTEIPQPPKRLFIEGALPDLAHVKLLTVVGSRKFSRYGKEVCESLIRGLAGRDDIVIVSGLALGIDAIAHQAALDAGLTTIAVPGSGLDRTVLHPRTNHRLADAIVKSGGALISEYEPLQPAGLHTFPERNRIMVGMSHAVLLIEAAERSGTLITARLTSEYNRELLAVPHDITRITAKGVNQFLKLGATPITESADIIAALGLETLTEDTMTQAQLFSELSSEEQKVLEIVGADPCSRDDLIRTLGMPIHTANALLSAMELKDLITEKLGEVRIAA